MSADRDKIDAYLDTIRLHVLLPITKSDLKESCIATILLIFAAIDGLGKLTHPKVNAHTEDRFKWYLRMFMPPQYKTNQKPLYKLRNSLAHNALNFTAFISKTHMGKQHHLQPTPHEYIFVSSAVLTCDFEASIRTLEHELAVDPDLVCRAAARLQWIDDDPSSYWTKVATPPGPVSFITLR